MKRIFDIGQSANLNRIVATITWIVLISSMFYMPAATLTSATYSSSVSTGMHKTEDIFGGGFSPQEVVASLGKPFDVSFSICPTKDAPNTVIRFIIPFALVKLVHGDSSWTGNVKKRETVVLSLSLEVQEDVKATVRADVKTGLKYFSSFFLQIATENAAAGAGPCKILPVSEADLPATSNPESTRAISSAKATEKPTVGPDQLRFYGTFYFVNDQGGYSPARYMNVKIMDDDGLLPDEEIWSGWTDANGYYDVITDNNDGLGQDGRDPYVQLWAIGQYDWETQNGAGDTYFAQTSVLKEECVGGEEFAVGGVPAANNEAWMAGDACWQEADWVWSHTSPSWEIGYRVVIYWPVGTWDYSGGDSIYLHAGFGGHTTVLHEYGHCVMWNAFGGSWPEGAAFCTHWVGFEDPHLADAWEEGWAEFMECAVENNPNNLQGNWQNIETNTWWDWDDPEFGDGAYIEGEVASILWDIFDPADVLGDDDHMLRPFNDIFTVLHYGDAGTDDNPNSILDFWDDWNSRWPDVTTSIGPLCDIYYNYGIDKDWYAPWGWMYIDQGDYTNSRWVTLTLWADDWGAGVGWMRFSEDGGLTWTGWYAYSTTFSYYITSPGDGWKWIDVQFGDPWWDSPSYADGITLDTTPPTGAVVINSGAGYTNSRWVTLTISASDSLTGVAYMRFADDYPTLTWSDWYPYAATFDFYIDNPGDGTKAIDVQFIDWAGNPTTPGGIYDHITLDTTAPTGSIIINSGNPAYTTSTSVTLYLSYGDNFGVKEVYYGNTGEYWQGPFSPTATMSWTLPSGDGTKTVWYLMYDNAGNSYMCSDSITLDTTAPIGSITINSGDPTYTTSTSVTLYLTYGDSLSGVKEVYYLNSGDPSWTGPFNPTGTMAWTLSSGDGSKAVYYLIFDYAGNYYVVGDSIVLDTTVPTGSIIINSGDPAYTTSTSVTLYLTYGDSLSGVKEVYYGNVGEYWQGPYSPTATTSWALSSGDGTKAVWYMIYDYAGNFYMCSDSIILDTVAPFVTSFTVTPTPFTPNGDGIKDTTTVAATFSETVDWEIQLKDSVGTVLLTWTGTGTSLSIVWDGKVGSTVVADGAYEFVLSGEDLANWSLSTETEPVTVVTATLAGDIDYDGDVDYSDFVVLAGAYGSTIGQPGYNSDADIDGDGDIDYSDFVILAGNYSKQWP